MASREIMAGKKVDSVVEDMVFVVLAEVLRGCGEGCRLMGGECPQ